MIKNLVFAIVLSLLVMVAVNWEKHVAYKKGYEAGYKDCKLELLERGNENEALSIRSDDRPF